MSKIVKVLCGDHRTFCQLLDLIEQEVEVFRKAGQPDYALLEAVLEYFEGYPHCTHLPAENLVYEQLRVRAPELCQNIPEPRGEHRCHAERLASLMQLMRRVLAEGEIPREMVIDAAQSFVDHMRRHVEMEETRFLPAAIENLRAEDWAEIEARLRDPGRQAGGKKHYDDLRREILSWGAESIQPTLESA